MIALLGSTGSIGTNTLDICERFGIEVEVLVAGNNIELLKKQVERFKPHIVVTAKPADIKAPVVLSGEEGILEALQMAESKLVVNALVGFLGLRPTQKSLELGKRIALANKESLVIAGAFLDRSRIVPIDSEHFGLWYLLQNSFAPKKLLLTASGGALREWDIQQIQKATLEEVLRHPNWKMGPKITIDSATMVNKLFELLEAYWLFGINRIDAMIEPSSIIHAAVEFVDGSTTLHASLADMRLPIAYALGVRGQKILEPIDLIGKSFSFLPIDLRRYPVWSIKEELLAKPKKGVVLNAANEAAIKRFLNGSFCFGDIARAILRVWEHFDKEAKSLEEVFTIDDEVRRYVQNL